MIVPDIQQVVPAAILLSAGKVLMAPTGQVPDPHWAKREDFIRKRAGRKKKIFFIGLAIGVSRVCAAKIEGIISECNAKRLPETTRKLMT